MIYLDANGMVIHLLEHLGPFRIAPIRRQCHSVLQLPPRAIYASNTQVGDKLLICSPAQMNEYWNAEGRVEPDPLESTEAVPAKGTTMGGKRLFTRLKEWLKRPADRRAWLRRSAPALVAYYWDGAVPKPHPIANISSTGAFILTPQKWYRGTLMNLRIQTEPPQPDAPGLVTRAKVVRVEPEGVAVQFVFLNARERQAFDRFMGDKKRQPQP